MVGVEKGKRAHVLMIPVAEEQCHFAPFVHVLYHLSTLDITVTFCSSKRRIAEVQALHSEGSLKELDLRLVELNEDAVLPPRIPAGGMSKVFQNSSDMRVQFQKYRDELLAEKNPANKPTFLLVDTFLDWTELLAVELHIPRYMMFACSGWIPLAILYVKLEGWTKSGDDIVELPGYPSSLAKEIPAALFPLTNIHKCDGVLINSFQELEGEGYDAFLTYCNRLATKFAIKAPTYLPIGPTNLLTRSAKETSDSTDSNALNWLHKQAPTSIVYVAFGTVSHVSNSLIYELARGLELSNVPFLWVLRHSDPDFDMSKTLPPGFQARVGDRGFIETAFAPQLKILQHPSTGAFITHSGWSSTLEAMTCGLPILTWHLAGDQPINARILVNQLKVGLPIRELGSNDLVVAGEIVASKVRSLMVDKDPESQAVRENAARWKKKAQSSMSEDGSSFKNLQHFSKAILDSA